MTRRLPYSTAEGFKRPQNKEEERKFKKGHVEDDNIDVAYFNFGLFQPYLYAFIVAVILLIAALVSSIRVTVMPEPSIVWPYFLKVYGQHVYNCSTEIPVPTNGLYSIVNLFDISLPGNLIFRVVTTYPMAVRLFNSLIFRMKSAEEMSPTTSNLYKFVNEMSPTVTLIEVSSLALFSIITSHIDSDIFHLVCKKIFAIASATNMVISTMVVFTRASRSNATVDLISLIVKSTTCIIYCTAVPQIFIDPFSDDKPCYALLPRESAVKEYVAIIAYLIYHGTTIIDVRNIRFSCFPRTCSGECEPVDPVNFVKGGKYEHCRSWEYNQNIRITNIRIN